MGRALHLAVALVVGLGGCSVALGYPPVEREQGEEACHDGEDDDLDGLVDCLDLDCTGACAEEGDACANERDDDGDDLIDAHDPQCWIGAPIATERCAEIAATHFAPVLDGTARGWSGDGVFVADPRTSGAWVMSTAGAPSGLDASEIATGRVEGTSLQAAVDLPLGGSAVLWLAAADVRVLEEGADAIALELLAGQAAIVLHGPTTSVALPLPARLEPGWHYVRIELAAGAGPGLRVRLELGPSESELTPLGAAALTCTPDEPLCVPPTWARDEALRFAWTGTPSAAGEVLVGDVVLDRPNDPPCGYPDPQMQAAATATQLVAAARGGGAMCALTRSSDLATGRTTLTSWRSDDDGRRWDGPHPVSDTLENAAAIAWDGTQWSGAAIVDDGHGNARRVVALESTDCLSWSSSEELIASVVSNVRASALDYAIGPFGEGGAAVHELWFRYGDDLLRMTSPTGAAGSWQVASGGAATIAIPHDPEIDAATSRSQRHVLRIGTDLAVVYGSGRETRLLVRTRNGAWLPRATPLLGASHTEGAFDSASVAHALFVMLDRPETGSPWPARMLYTGDGSECAQCSVTGTANLYFGTETIPSDAPP